jgi:Tfp pilus assembly protein PilO
MSIGDLFYKLGSIQKSLVIIGACAIFFGLFYLTVLSSFDFGTLNKDTENVKRDIAAEEEKEGKGKAIANAIQDYNRELQSLVKSLPERDELDGISKQLDELLTEIGIQILKFVPEPERLNEEYMFATIPSELTLLGEYKKLGQFFTRLDKLPRLMHVERLILKPKEGQMKKSLQPLLLNATVTLVTYRRLSQEEVQSLSQKKNPGQSKKP